MEHRKNTNKDSYMYRDYSKENEIDIDRVAKESHGTQRALLAKTVSKLHGRAGRFRGKNGSQENNKARGGKMAR